MVGHGGEPPCVAPRLEDQRVRTRRTWIGSSHACRYADVPGKSGLRYTARTPPCARSSFFTTLVGVVGYPIARPGPNLSCPRDGHQRPQCPRSRPPALSHSNSRTGQSPSTAPTNETIESSQKDSTSNHPFPTQTGVSQSL